MDSSNLVILLVLVVLIPYSLWRQLRVHEVNAAGLFKMPAIFIAIGVLGFGIRQDIPTDGAATLYLLISLLVAVGFGVWRGYLVKIWQEGETFMEQGTRVTLTLWIAMIVLKIAMGTVASITGIFPGEHAGEIFIFIGISFAVQAAVVGTRTIWRRPGVQSA